jgi:hypothetical protein
MVGERGFEPPTPWSRTRCSTRLSHSPTTSVVCAKQDRETRPHAGPKIYDTSHYNIRHSVGFDQSRRAGGGEFSRDMKNHRGGGKYRITGCNFGVLPDLSETLEDRQILLKLTF